MKPLFLYRSLCDISTEYYEHDENDTDSENDDENIICWND
ncbi:hypothetical protein A3Q56_01106 [Intoshia linei]|uniref:Uncharacterized protein n=1 Tax=Intoshia linei TaxID=1819745 RepID=A0A177BC79_9BILA|nr:hypothetical protein A3Q56_01106 [Intoshia linei]